MMFGCGRGADTSRPGLQARQNGNPQITQITQFATQFSWMIGSLAAKIRDEPTNKEQSTKYKAHKYKAAERVDKLVEQFLEHLRYERNVSVHTLRNYQSDLDQ